MLQSNTLATTQQGFSLFICVTENTYKWEKVCMFIRIYAFFVFCFVLLLFCAFFFFISVFFLSIFFFFFSVLFSLFFLVEKVIGSANIHKQKKQKNFTIRMVKRNKYALDYKIVHVMGQLKYFNQYYKETKGKHWKYYFTFFSLMIIADFFKTLINFPSYGLNSTTTVLRGEWIWH